MFCYRTVAIPNKVTKISVSIIGKSVRLYKCRPIWLSILSCWPSPEQVSKLDARFSSSSFVLFSLSFIRIANMAAKLFFLYLLAVTGLAVVQASMYTS